MAETTTWRKLHQTPLRDLLRLRITGRLDWHAMLADAALPEQAKDLIYTVVKRTRLWRMEQVSVTRELISHFQDAIDEGVPIERAIKRFGDAKRASKLIRRAKLRNRPLAWQALKWARRAIAALIVFYVGAGVYFAMGSPSPSVDYLAKLNEPILATPESDWAWPIYRTTLKTFADDEFPAADVPTDEGWDKTVAWVMRNPSALETIRRGARKSSLGAPLSRQIDPEDDRAIGKTPSPQTAQDSLVSQSLVAVLLPQLRHMRTFTRALAADTIIAAQANDAARVESDLQAIFSLAEQLRKRDMLVTDLVGIGIRSIGLRAMGYVLEQHPTLLDDAALIRLAHRLSPLNNASDLVTFKGERYMFNDLVQRIYTDDGNGDGRMTTEGIQFLRSLQPMVSTASRGDADAWFNKPAEIALGPAFCMISASRKNVMDEYNTYMDAQEARLARPLRDVHEPDPEARALSLRSDTITSLRYMLVRYFMPALNRVQVSAERVLSEQEALQTVIALELYRRHHDGQYPASLDVLSPRYLPRVPVDRIGGSPLRYKLVDGKPLLYSVGADRDDDGGRPPADEPMRAAEWTATKPVDGDWVLYPIPTP